jgi:hypothetical protein
MGGTQRLPHLVGLQRGLDMMLGSQVIKVGLNHLGQLHSLQQCDGPREGDSRQPMSGGGMLQD